MSDTVEFARSMLAVARHKVADLLLDYDPEHQRVKDARESVRGWTAEVERLERREEAEVLAVARLTAGVSEPAPHGRGSLASPAPAVSCAHDDFHFSRSLCACGSMHYYCNDCGEQLGPCDESGCVCGDPGDCQGCA